MRLMKDLVRFNADQVAMELKSRIGHLLVACIGMFAVVSPFSAQAQIVKDDLKVIASNGTLLDDFGRAVAIEGTNIAVGAPMHDGIGPDSGAVFLYDTTTGAEYAQLAPTDSTAGQQFGYSVAMDGGIVAIGAPRDSENGGNAGAVYLFSSTTGLQLNKLLPLDGESFKLFGWSVAIEGGIVVVGMPFDDDNGLNAGAAYVFDATTGVQLNKLLPTDGDSEDLFGHSVAIDLGTVAVGAYTDEESALAAGSVYLFDAATGVESFKLLASDGRVGDWFGWSVAIDNGVVAVGAIRNDSARNNAGAVYLFNSTTGVQDAQLFATDFTVDDEFGYSIGIDNNFLIVGSYHDDDNGFDSGSAYLFDVPTGAQLSKFISRDGAAQDWLGFAVDIDSGLYIVGANQDDDNGTNSGSAYVFDNFCLQLEVDNLVAGDTATFTISGGTPGAGGITVYGFAAGTTAINNVADYCATFEIAGVNAGRVLGGLGRTFNASGEISFGQFIPPGAVGLDLLFQSAERSTCPNECMSNLFEATVL